MLRNGGPEEGRGNALLAWWMIGISMAAGALIGLWSFGGPVPAPEGFRDYACLPRRLVRLAHIAAIMLPVLNLLYIPWMARSRWNRRGRRFGLTLLAFGTVALPCFLTAAAFLGPALYLLPLPVTALILSILWLALGLSFQGAKP